MATSINWPVTLPQVVLQQQYKETLADSSIRTQMDAGPAKVRRRFVAASKPYTVAIFLLAAQVQYLEDFYETTTESGTLTFNIPDPRTGVTTEMRFLSVPIITSDQANFIAIFDLEKLP